MNSEFHEQLQYTTADNPVSIAGKRVAEYPRTLENIALDAVEELDGFTLVPWVKNGVNRFALRRPNGTVLTPMDKVRLVEVSIQGKKKHFNVSNLLASSLLHEDVTDNEFGILICEDGLIVESAADRAALCADRKRACLDLPRVDLGLVARPNSNDIDVRGKGYYVERGVVYKKNGRPIHVTKRGEINLTGKTGKREIVGVGWILFAAYPAFYNYKHGLHTQMDHINGIPTDNEAWNFRPMTVLQNAAVRHCTGSRSERPAYDSSHETFKRGEGNRVTRENIAKWIADGRLKRYMKTSYWLHSDGAVLRQTRSGSFVFAPLTVQRYGYTYISGVGNVHVMMMKAFGRYVDGLVIMHLDDDKQNNRLDNLQMGTSRDNATGKKSVTIHIRREDGTEDMTTYESVRDAARLTGICHSTISYNRGQQRPGSPPRVFTTTQSGIRFARVPAKGGRRFNSNSNLSNSNTFYNF